MTQDQMDTAIRLITAVAALIAATSGLSALVWFQSQQLRLIKRHQLAEWEERLRAAYSSFWADEKLVEVRYWIVSDVGYATIQPLLKRRLVHLENKLDKKDNEVLDKIDRFFAVIFSAELLGADGLSPEQDLRIRRVYGYYWVIINGARPELRKYAERFWSGSVTVQELRSSAGEARSPA